MWGWGKSGEVIVVCGGVGVAIWRDTSADVGNRKAGAVAVSNSWGKDPSGAKSTRKRMDEENREECGKCPVKTRAGESKGEGDNYASKEKYEIDAWRKRCRAASSGVGGTERPAGMKEK